MIDTDGVIRNFADSLKREWVKKYPKKKLLPFDRYELWECMSITKKRWERFVYQERAKEIFLNADPYPGALGFLKDLYVRGYRIVLASSQDNHKLEKITMDWYDKHKIKYDEVLFIKDKCDYNCDLLIEDTFSQINLACISKKLYGTPKEVIRIPRLYNKYTNQNLHYRIHRDDMPLTAYGKDTYAQFDWIINWLDENMKQIPNKDSKVRQLTAKLKEVGKFSGQYRTCN